MVANKEKINDVEIYTTFDGHVDGHVNTLVW
jgi:hypothetical protein